MTTGRKDLKDLESDSKPSKKRYRIETKVCNSCYGYGEHVTWDNSVIDCEVCEGEGVVYID